MNDNIHIFVKIDSTRWKRASYKRSLLLSQLIKSNSSTFTLWDTNPSKRLKMISQMPSGELVNEMSVLFLSNPAFTHFIRKVDSVKSIYIHTDNNIEKEIHKIVPITEDDSPDSFGIKIEGEETKFFSYCNYIDDSCKNPIDYQIKDEGMYIGEMAYFYKDMIPLFLKLRERFTMLLSYVRDFDNKTQDQKHLESMLPKIIHKLDLILQGKNVTESLSMYLSLVKINLNANDNTIINEIETQLKKNKPKRYLHGYGSWYQIQGTKLNTTNYTLLEYSPYRKEIRGIWNYDNLEGPCIFFNNSNEKINFKISYIEKHNELLKLSFYCLKSKDFLKIGINENKENKIFKSIKISKDTSQYTIESILTQEVLRYLIQLYLSDQENNHLYSCMAFLCNSIISHHDFISNTEILSEDTELFYHALTTNEVIKKLFLKNISVQDYYKNIIGYISSCINKDNYLLSKDIISKIDTDIRKSYKDFYGDTLLHMASYLIMLDKDFSISWIKEMINADKMDINSTDNTNKTIIHSLLYNTMDYFGTLIDDEEYVKDSEEVLLELLKEEVDINKQDDNGLTVLHLSLMLKFDKIKEVIELILEKNPDLALKSSYPVETTPLQIAILFNQDKSIIEKIKEKIGLEAFKSQLNIDVISHVKDLYNSSVDEKEDYQNKLNIKYDVNKQDDKDTNDTKEDKAHGETRTDNKEQKDKEDIEKDNDTKDDEEVEESNVFEKIKYSKTYMEIKDIILNLTKDKVNDIDEHENTVGHLILQNDFIIDNFDSDEIINVFRNLYEKNYNINAINYINESPLLMLVKLLESNNDILSVAKVFLSEFDSDPDNTNDEGISPLYIAVKNKDENLVKLLVDYDSSISSEVETLLKTNDNEEIQKMLN